MKKWLKISIIVLITILTLGFNTDKVEARPTGSCSYWSGCGCSTYHPGLATSWCISGTCWWSNPDWCCNGHSLNGGEWFAGTTATCTRGGTNEYKITCTRCGSAHSYYYSTGPLGHSYGDWYSINDTQHQKKCSKCGATENASHGFGNWASKNGSVHSKSCGTCRKELTQAHDFKYEYFNNDKSRNYICQVSTCRHNSYTQHLLTVTYDSNCTYQSGNNDGTWITHNTNYSVTAKGNTGYGFGHTCPKTNCQTSYTKTESGTMTAPKTINFVSSPIIYNITYNLNNGANNSANPSTYNITSSAITFQNPSKTGAKFLGWSLTSIASGSTGCKTTTASWESYVFTLTLDANGGQFNDGKTTKIYKMPYYTNPNDATAATYSLTDKAPFRSGYTFMGWNLSRVWKNNNVAGTVDVSKTANKTANEYSYIVTGTGIETKNNSGIIYAQWEKVITYNFNYYNNGATTQSVIVKFHNNDKDATITKFANNGQYGTPGDGTTIRNVDEGTIALTNITSNKSIKFGGTAGVYNWNFNGLAKENQSAIAPRYEGTAVNTKSITVHSSDVSGEAGTVNFYASYYRQPEITFIDYEDNKQIVRKVNGSDTYKNYITNNLTAGINNKQTVQNTTTVYAKYNGAVQQEVVVTLLPQSSMKLIESNGKNVGVNEAWVDNGWTTGSTLTYAGTPTNIGTTFDRTPVFTLTGTAGKFDDQKENTKINTYQNLTYYGLYKKDVTVTADPNGGTINKNKYSTIRNVNAYNINASTKPIITVETPIYINNTGAKFKFKIWTYDKLAINDTQMEAHRLRNELYCTDNCIRLHNGEIIHTQKCNTFTLDIHELRNNGTATYEYTPLVSETIYAAWTNDTPPNYTYEPKVTINKAAEWYNASASDTGLYDFDALGNINLDGIVKVTITIRIENPANINSKNMVVTDYFNTNIWDLYDLGGLSSRNGDKLTWNITNTSSGTKTCTYYLKLKEKYWTKDASGDCKYINNEIGSIASDSNGSAYSNMVNGKLYYNYYTNKIPNITSYLNSIDANGIIKSTDSYFYSSDDARKSYIWIDYKVNGGFYNDAERQIHNKSADVKMRQVSFKPVVSNGVNIETDENNTKDYLNGMHTNIYHDYSSAYNNTYFVKYNTKGDYDSTFKISMASQLTKSYSYYQISDNLFDVVATTTKKEQVIDNQIAVSATKNNTSVLFKENIADTTDASKKVNADMLANKHLRSGFGSQLLLDVDAQLTLHSSVNTNGVIYNNAAASTKTTLHATNQDNLYISIYPFVKTTNTKTGISYSISDRLNEIEYRNKRLDLIIDATDPVITADSNLISADGSDKTTWNKYNQYCKDNDVKSDGYIDINLINKSTNKTGSVEEYDYIPGTENPYTYEFKFYDAVSGISDPTRANDDWIKSKHDNIIVTLTRVDDGKVLFDSSKNVNYKNNKYISLSYETAAYNVTNKNASLKVQFYANDPDNLGHIQLKIRVYDNVYNYTDKVYDFYTFALTADISVVETLLNLDPTRYNEPTIFYNGEQGRINISANGFVDRTTVNFSAALNQAYLKDYGKFYGKFAADVPETINGNYPDTDYNSSQYVAANDPFKASKLYAIADNKLILPKGCQQVYWGYQDGKYGGLTLSTVNTNANQGYTINTGNIALKKMLPEIIARYIAVNNFGETFETITGEHNGNKYIITDKTLYINPVYNPNGTVQTAEYIIKVKDAGTLYGLDNVPTTITIDGAVTIPVTYTVNIGNNLTPEQIITALANGASIPNTAFYPYISSDWIATSGGYRRPLVHYFYMPLQAKEQAHEVSVTAYQDSETGWAHKVTITLVFNNNEDSPLKDLNTIIQDN